jgi:hypothetical protein
MHPVAHSALVASIVTSALGAVLLCVLVFRFGFSPDEDESPEERTWRFFVTRLGHASGAVCFALTAGLAVVAGVVQSRGAAPPEREPAALAKLDATEPAPPASVLTASVIDVAALRESQERTVGDVRSLEERVKSAESELASMRETAAAMAARIERTERAERARERAVAASERTERAAERASRPVERAERPVERTERAADGADRAIDHQIERTERTTEPSAPALSLPPRTGTVPAPVDARPPDAPVPSGESKPPVPRAIQAPPGTFESRPSVETPTPQPSVTTVPSPSVRPPERPRRLDREGAEFARQAARTVQKFADEVKDGMATFGRRVRQFVDEELR